MNARLRAWAGAAALALACSSGNPTGVDTSELDFVRWAEDAPALETNLLRFDACVGRSSKHEIDYVDGDDFLEFKVRSGTIVQDAEGNPLGDGECVEITITVDESRYLFRFGPAGLVFGEPAELEIAYTHADPFYLAQEEAMKVWRQERAGDPWFEVAPLRFDVDFDEIEIEIPGFTRYALAVN